MPAESCGEVGVSAGVADPSGATPDAGVGSAPVSAEGAGAAGGIVPVVAAAADDVFPVVGAVGAADEGVSVATPEVDSDVFMPAEVEESAI